MFNLKWVQIIAAVLVLASIIIVLITIGDFSINTLVAIILTIMVVAITSLLVGSEIYRRSKNEKHYDEIEMKSSLDSMRDRLENKLYDIENRLMATEERWKDVNHLLLSSQKALPEQLKTTKVPVLSDFLRGFGLTENDLYIDKKLVFVLTPFNETKRDTYDAIVDVCNKVGLICMRGDEEYVKGELLPHIIRQIVRARVIIANIEGRNPNVYYELGIAYAIDKPIIIVSRSISEALFDVKSKHLIIYRDNVSLKNKLRTALTKVFIKE
ncbi:MAG: hypothetical protein PHG35_06130 [Dehalococcoidales bacterium]|nr:hypothetical protein [Dehalococcoidales bacterium]